MDFELHVTVDPPSKIVDWISFCRAHKIKPVLVELSKGQYPLQMMCAVNLRCSFVEMDACIDKLEKGIENAGFKIMRTKVECSLPAMARRFPAILYHETHFIFTLTLAQLGAFTELGEKLQMAWSRNLLPREDTLLKYYLTQRIGGETSPRVAELIFAEKLMAARKVLPVRSVHLESAIYDCGRYIDRDWIE